MANSYSSLYVHYVFSTKNREPLLKGDFKERLWAIMGGIAKENRITPRCIGGVSDHVHLLLSLPATTSVAKAIQIIKGGSSKWVHETFPKGRYFSWQEGYGAFSVSISNLVDTIKYIENQEEHHRTRTFREEYLSFLHKHGIEADEKYLWT
jgi:putative transposase